MFGTCHSLEQREHNEPSAWNAVAEPVLTKPDISDDTIVACALDTFGLRISEATFLPSGDDNSAVYRVTTDGHARYLLKLRRGDFDEVCVVVPAYLHSQGLLRVMAPIAATTNQLSVHAHGFDWMLYPFFEGKTGFETPLSRAQWIALGETMRKVHTAILPAGLASRVPHESYSIRNRAIARALDTQVERRIFDDPVAAHLAAFWRANRGEILTIVERAEQLAPQVQQRAAEFCLCHSDLHAGNVLLGADDELVIVDWDNPILAPKERDLMFIGGGIGGAWNDPREREWFYTGYGPTEIDSVAIAFYRYERIVADICAYGEQTFGLKGTAEDRKEGAQRFMSAFLPNNPIESAHRSWLELP
jgi:spectinomycin phosphotransferase